MKCHAIKILGLVAFCAALFLSSPTYTTAQTSGGTIAGTVLDSTGALVSGANVVATGADTGTVYTTVSTSAGTFHFPQMQLGRYNLKVTAAGFSSQELTGILVTTGNVAPAEVRLATGSATDTVTVSGDAPVVETENSEVSNTISSRQIVDLPLSLGGQGALRSVEAFIFLAPGTVGPGTAGSSSGAFQSKTAGGQQFGTEELLDGISVRREDSNSAFDEHAPSIEALTELKVTTSIIPATEGRTTGGINNFSTKSGTNKYHGTAYEFFRNEDLDANLYFNKLNIAKATPDNFAATFKNNQRPADKQNDFGGTAGGPIIIPHLYNGRDKTFGFFSFEQYRQSNGGNSTSDIPTAAVRGGDFGVQLTTTPDGNLIDCTGKQVFKGEIFDPATTSTVFNPDANGPGKPGATVPCRNPFPNNVIPTSRFSTVANNVLKFYPLPNTGAAGQITRNYTYSTSFPKLNTVYTIRVDHSFSTKSKIFVTYTDRDNAIVNGHPPYPGPGGAVQLQNAFAKYLRAGSDYQVSPTSFNHFVGGLTRLYQINFANSLGFTPDFDKLLGISGASGVDFPQFSFGSTYVNYNGVGYNNNDVQPVNALQIADTYSLILGRHSLSFGGDFRKDQYTNEANGGASGSFNFSPFQTAGGIKDSLSGDSFASLLLGQTQSATLSVQAKAPRIGQAYYATFIQDDFKVAHNLLLNLGLRYDIDKPKNEAHGNFSNFSPTTPNPGAGGIPGSLIFAGTGAGRIGGSGEFAETYKKDFAPRIGFAYSPDNSNGKTSLRGGFGIYYGPLDYADFGGGQSFGFTASPSFSSPDNFTQAYCKGVATTSGQTSCNGVTGLDQGFPAYAPPPNLDPTQQNGQDLGGAFNGEYIAKSFGRPAAIYNWGLQVQQELATDLILTLGYIGTSGTHLHSDLAQINDLNPKYYALGKSALDSTTGFTPPYPGFSGTLAQSLRAFPQYLTINTAGSIENLGHSNYQALTAKLERRFHSGLNLLASYTWSKSLTDADSALPIFAAFTGGAGTVQNPYNLRSEKAISFQDVPQNFVVSYVYELPLGKGKKLLNHGGVVNAVVGGFQVGGIQRYLSGTGVSFGCSPSGAPASIACNRYNIDPNFINRGPSAHVSDPTQRQAFNPAAFHDPGADAGGYALGTSPRVTGAYRSPVYKNEDLSLTKHLANLGEYGDLQLHVDIFNAFNRTHFNAPDTTPTDSTFGSTQGAFGTNTQRQFVLRYTF